MSYQLPDWDAWAFQNTLYTDKKDFYTDKEYLLEYLNLLDDNIITLERYQFHRFNPKIEEIEVMLERDRTIDSQQIALTLMANHGQPSINPDWNETFFSLEILTQIKMVLSNPFPNIEYAQKLLDKWTDDNSVIHDGCYVATGETAEIDLNQLSDCQWNYTSQNSGT